MAARFILPTWQVLDNNGDPLGGAKANFYTSGTLTRKDTFVEESLSTANANPVVADSAGRFGDIFLESGNYRVVLTDSDDVQIWDRDPVDGAAGNSGTVDEITSAYTVAIGDSTKTLAVNATSAAVTITLLAAATAGDGFELTVKKTDSSTNAVTLDGNGAETIDGASTLALTNQYSAVTVRSDGANWQIVQRGLSTELANVFKKTQTWSKGADIASPAGGALTLGTDGNYFDITGTNAITSIVTVGVGTVVKLHFDAALVLTHHATDLILPGAASITTAADDEAEFVEYATGDWRCTNYVRATAAPLFYATQAQQEAATSDKAAVTPAVQHMNLGHPKGVFILTGLTGTPSITTLFNGGLSTVSAARTGTGDHTFNWSATLTNPSVQVTVRSNAASSAVASINNTSGVTGTSVRFDVENNAGTQVDPDEIHIAIWGNLP